MLVSGFSKIVFCIVKGVIIIFLNYLTLLKKNESDGFLNIHFLRFFNMTSFQRTVSRLYTYDRDAISQIPHGQTSRVFVPKYIYTYNKYGIRLLFTS